MTQDATSNHWNHLIAPKNQGVCKFFPTEYVILMMGKKSCTKWDVLNPVIDGQITTSTGAGILPSTVSYFVQPCPSPSINFVVPQFWGHVFFWINDWTKLRRLSASSFLKSGLKPIIAACCRFLLKRRPTFFLPCLLACLLTYLLPYLLTYLIKYSLTLFAMVSRFQAPAKWLQRTWIFPNGILGKKRKAFNISKTWGMKQPIPAVNDGISILLDNFS